MIIRQIAFHMESWALVFHKVHMCWLPSFPFPDVGGRKPHPGLLSWTPPCSWRPTRLFVSPQPAHRALLLPPVVTLLPLARRSAWEAPGGCLCLAYLRAPETHAASGCLWELPPWPGWVGGPSLGSCSPTNTSQFCPSLGAVTAPVPFSCLSGNAGGGIRAASALSSRYNQIFTIELLL